MSLCKTLLLPVPIVAATALSGCTSTMSYLGQEPPPPQEIPVAAVVNAIKCDINDFFFEQQAASQTPAFRLKIDRHTLATIKLKLRVTRGGGLAFSQINVIGTPLQALVSARPGAAPLTLGGSASSTMSVEVAITMEQSASRALDCGSRKGSSKGLMLKDWLTKLMDQNQRQMMTNGPSTRLSEIVLTTDFEVGASAGISPAIAIVPVLVPPTLSASTSSTHQLQITLKGDADRPDSHPPTTPPAKAAPAKTSSAPN